MVGRQKSQDLPHNRGGRSRRCAPRVAPERAAQGFDDRFGPRGKGRAELESGPNEALETMRRRLPRGRRGPLDGEELGQRQRKSRGPNQAAEEGSMARTAGEKDEGCNLGIARQGADQGQQVGVRQGVVGNADANVRQRRAHGQLRSQPDYQA